MSTTFDFFDKINKYKMYVGRKMCVWGRESIKELGSFTIVLENLMLSVLNTGVSPLYRNQKETIINSRIEVSTLKIAEKLRFAVNAVKRYKNCDF